MKLVQISDTHLSHRGGVTQDNFERLVAHVNEQLRPDLVVHSGDVVIADPDATDDHRRAHELMQRFAAPVRVVPGNHDVGAPGEHPWKGLSVTDERVAAFEQIWGDDHWRHDLDGWTVLGLDSELFGSGLDREAEQWRWLEQTVEDMPADRPTLVFLHKPIWSAAEGVTEHQLDVGDQARARLLDLLGRVALRGVGSGHLHRFRETVRDGVVEVWAPSTAFVAGSVGDALPAGVEQLGVVAYECDRADVRVDLQSPAGLTTASFAEVPEMRDTVAEIDARAAL
jgi:3',5'-cyclic AMP phosphodiesterase CpdA